MRTTRVIRLLTISMLILAVMCWSAPAVANSGDIRANQTPYNDSGALLTVTWSPSFPDTNYTAVCTAETIPSDFLLPVIASRSAGSMNVDPTDGGSPTGTLDCMAIPDSDSSDIRHARAPFSGRPASVNVPWNTSFSDTNYTAVCTVETRDNLAGGFTSVISAVNPGSITVTNGGFDSGTMHCIAIPDSDSGEVRRSRVAASGNQTVSVPWNQAFPDKNYAAVCSDEVLGAQGSDSAIAISANSKLPGSMTVIPEIASGTVHCLAATAPAVAQATYSFVGVPFTQFMNTGCPPTCHISGSFTLSQPLPPNLVGSIGGSGDFTPLYFSFTDGNTVFNDGNSQYSGFAVDTDASGNITLFSFYLIGPGGGGGMYAYCGGPGTLTQEGVNVSDYQAMFEGQDAPCGTWIQSPALRLVPIAPCRVVDTRNSNGQFGGPPLQGGLERDFSIPQSSCNIPDTAAAYSLNVTVVPHGPLGYLTVWPRGETQPLVSTLNSYDGRVKANAAIVPAGTQGAVSFYVTDTTDLVLDIDGYFVPVGTSMLAFYPLPPCRVADTRGASGDLGGPYLKGGVPRAFPILEASSCNIPSTAQGYSLNFTAVPHGHLGYLTVWPTGQQQPTVSTLNAPTGAITANAAIVPAGTAGEISTFAYDDTDLIIDINGYFAPPGQGSLSLYPVQPCRVLDTRPPLGNGAFNGTLNPPVGVLASACAPPSQAQAYVFNATVVPSGSLGYLTLWPDGISQPLVSTLNASDRAITSNMAIVPAGTGGKIDAFAYGLTNLILDISSYFAP
jgi:hypothetical protein